MFKELISRKDIYTLVSRFYNKLLKDTHINFFFTDLDSKSKLEEHLSVLVDFWDNVLFNSGSYTKNAMLPHLLKNESIPFKKEHFTIWLNHFNTSVDELFIGHNANQVKVKALSMATVMQIKLQSN